MVFPMAECYRTNSPVPPFVIQFLLFLSYIQRAVIWILNAVGLGILLADEYQVPPPSFLVTADHDESPLPRRRSACWSLPTPTLIRQALPSSPYEPPSKEERKDDHDRDSAPDSCAVCLHGFEAGEEVRRLGGCRHIFHVCCIDQWVDIGRRTCPLCRAQLVPQEMLRQAVIAAGKNIRPTGHDAVDAAAPDFLDSYSSSTSYLYGDELYYGGDGDYYPVLQDQFNDF